MKSFYTYTRTVALAAMLSAGAGSAFAQSTPNTTPPPVAQPGAPVGAPGAERKPDPKKLEELRMKILDTKHKKLVEVLGMDEQTSKKFFELYTPAELDMEQLAKHRRDESEKLQRLLGATGNDAEIDPQVAKVRDLGQKIEARQLKLDQDLKPLISARQRAKLLMFEYEFNRRLQEKLAQGRRGPGAPGGPGAPQPGQGGPGMRRDRKNLPDGGELKQMPPKRDTK